MILLDTHVVVWMNGTSRKLSRAAVAAIRRSRHHDGLAISAITLVATNPALALVEVGPCNERGETV